jgi:hypothetical protein
MSAWGCIQEVGIGLMRNSQPATRREMVFDSISFQFTVLSNLRREATLTIPARQPRTVRILMRLAGSDC